ncbi:MAG TPA: efflux RND transporter periplasmic adaptor subunit [Dokdonella sp.]|uniref:efflux RND transporter periplasmic adaptor subunit n=1 Tax=Dokdonella sp. TaxID=2291710 RepID=UPI002D7E96CC|nr:efflux RND transporter periplasmic adaptor subunit [Dokdonella sp.]HET9034459.1 efflux RND transporter periplasmic adaptor subunit [Dokdonella sp.]
MNPRSERKPSSRKRMIIMIFLVGGFLAVLIGWNFFQSYMGKKYAENAPVPAQTVTSAKVVSLPWQPEQSSVGTLRAAQGADLAFDVGGIVTTVSVKSGSEVKKGQLLIELNADDLIAQRRQLEANAALLKVNLDRARQQLAYKGISQADFDSAEASYKAAQAGVNQQQALIDKRQLRAPFSGRVGIVSLTPGSYVKSGDVVLTLQQLDPAFVDLNIPQDKLAEVKVGQTVVLSLESMPDRPFLGAITAISPKLDVATRNAKVEASVPNSEKLLTPGMFANVAIQVGEEKPYLTLPQSAITFNPYGETVFLVKRSGKKDAEGKPAKPTAQSAFVTTGSKRGDQIAVLSGVKEGDEVVTSGQLKIKNGTPLIIDNSILPPNDAAPTPQEK